MLLHSGVYPICCYIVGSILYAVSTIQMMCKFQSAAPNSE